MVKKKIGYQGIPGAYSEKAAIKHFGDKVNLNYFRDFESVFKSINSNKIDFAVIPLENSLAGSILENFDHRKHTTFKSQLIEITS